MEATLKRLGDTYYNNYSSYLDKVEVDRNARTVTFTASIQTRTEVVQANGETITYRNPIDGTYANGASVSNPSGSATIKPVDGVDASDNSLIWGDATNETSPYQLTLISSSGITAEQLNYLNHNTLVVGDRSISFKDLGISVNESRQSIGKKNR